MEHVMRCLIGKQFERDGIMICLESAFMRDSYQFTCLDGFNPNEPPFPGKEFSKVEVESLRDWLNDVLHNYDASSHYQLCQNCSKVLPTVAELNKDGYWIVTCRNCEHEHEIGNKNG